VRNICRVMRWVHDEEDRIKSSGGLSLQHVILDMGGEAPTQEVVISFISKLAPTRRS